MEKDNRTNRYSPKKHLRAVRIVLDNQGSYEGPVATVKAIARRFVVAGTRCNVWLNR